MKRAGILSLVIALVLGIGLIGGLVLECGEAEAQNHQDGGVDALSRARQLYEAGAYSEAASMIEAAFKAGLTGDMAARAILLRAEINERGGALANALQDYSNAIWMESLPPAERKEAGEGKTRVMAMMGLASPNSSSTYSQQVAATPEPSSASDSLSGFFSGIFGSNTPPAQAQPVEPQPGSSESAVATQAQIQKATKPKKVAHAKAVARNSNSEQQSSALSVATPAPGILIVFGAASSEPSAQATAKTIKAQLSDILINRNLDVAPRPAGGFQIQAGPYKAKSSAVALCSAIRQRGISCQVTP